MYAWTYGRKFSPEPASRSPGWLVRIQVPRPPVQGCWYAGSKAGPGNLHFDPFTGEPLPQVEGFLLSSRPSRPLPWLKHPTAPSTPWSAYQPRPLPGAQGTRLTACSTFLHCFVLGSTQGTLGPVPGTVPTSQPCPPLPPQGRPKSGSHSQFHFSHSALAVSPFLLPPELLFLFSLPQGPPPSVPATTLSPGHYQLLPGETHWSPTGLLALLPTIPSPCISRQKFYVHFFFSFKEQTPDHETLLQSLHLLLMQQFLPQLTRPYSSGSQNTVRGTPGGPEGPQRGLSAPSKVFG